MGFISVRRVSKSFGRLLALSEISLEVEAGQFISIVGPSGCGKSTLLQIIGGLLVPTSGEVRLNDKPVAGPPREAIYVFQQYNRSLFPWRSVRANVAFGLEGSGMSRRDIDLK